MKRRAFTLRDAARLLTIPWAAWWIYFAFASMWSAPIITFLDVEMVAIATALFGGSAALVWQYERLGAALLAVEGLMVIIGYPLLAGTHMPFATTVFVLSTLGLPPLFSGVALLWLHLRPRPRSTA